MQSYKSLGCRKQQRLLSCVASRSPNEDTTPHKPGATVAAADNHNTVTDSSACSTILSFFFLFCTILSYPWLCIGWQGRDMVECTATGVWDVASGSSCWVVASKSQMAIFVAHKPEGTAAADTDYTL